MSVDIKMPFRFSRPDDRSKELLASLISGLPVVQEAKVRKTPAWKAHPARDALIDTVTRIHENLERDYLQNIHEAPDVPWTFDYQFSQSTFGKGVTGLDVCTRLIGPPEQKSGAIMYGTFVFRIDTDCYLHWPDQENEMD
jgi:hypothetical protein